MPSDEHATYVETEPGEWFYVLQEIEDEEEEYDEGAIIVGSFSTDDKAYDHLQDNHANPGSDWTYNHADLQAEPEKHEFYRKLVKRAQKPKEKDLLFAHRLPVVESIWKGKE